MLRHVSPSGVWVLTKSDSGVSGPRSVAHEGAKKREMSERVEGRSAAGGRTWLCSVRSLRYSLSGDAARPPVQAPTHGRNVKQIM